MLSAHSSASSRAAALSPLADPAGLKQQDWRTQQDLAAAVGTRARRSRTPRRLDKAGLIQRARDPNDRRAVRVELTDAGDKLFKRLAKAAIGFDQRLRTSLRRGLDEFRRFSGACATTSPPSSWNRSGVAVVVTTTVEDRPPQDEELVARAKRGERDAYEEIVRRHQQIAFRTAWVITGSAADAEEAAQDAFVKAYRALGRFREGAPLRPWLLTIVANEARNRVRAAGRRERLVLPGRGAPSGARSRRRSALLDFDGATSCSLGADRPERSRRSPDATS